MILDKILVDAFKYKINELANALKDDGFTNGQLLELVKTACEEVLYDLKQELWNDTIEYNKSIK